MRILISTPVYDEQLMVSYHRSIIGLLRTLPRRWQGLGFDHHLQATANLARARSIAATLVLEGSYSHLLFVDADMGFEPSLVDRMLKLGEPVVGCIYPRRRSDYRAFAAALGARADADQARMIGQPYVIDPSELVRDGAGEPMLRDGFVRILSVGAGVLLIRREALELLSERSPELWADDHHGELPREGIKQGRLFQVFAPTAPQPGGMLYSEDLSFCARWTGCGGEIWACVDETITHVGRERYVGNYQAVLDAQQARG